MCSCMFRMLLHCLTGWFRSRYRLGDKSNSKVVWGFVVVAFAFLGALMSQPPVFVITDGAMLTMYCLQPKITPNMMYPTELEYAGEQLERLYFSLVFDLFTLAFCKSAGHQTLVPSG